MNFYSYLIVLVYFLGLDAVVPTLSSLIGGETCLCWFAELHLVRIDASERVHPLYAVFIIVLSKCIFNSYSDDLAWLQYAKGAQLAEKIMTCPPDE